MVCLFCVIGCAVNQGKIQSSAILTDRLTLSDVTLVNGNTFKENLDLDMPMSYGAGVSYRLSDQFLISADFTRTHWDDFLLKNGDEISPITTLPKNKLDIDPTNTIRMGREYIFNMPNYVILLRAGVFHDPEN